MSKKSGCKNPVLMIESYRAVPNSLYLYCSKTKAKRHAKILNKAMDADWEYSVFSMPKEEYPKKFIP